MRYVLGMAKRHLDLRGSKAPKLELDFLRLLFAVRELRRNGQDAVGYLLVMTNAIKTRTISWARKYCCRDEVQVLLGNLRSQQRSALEAEVISNRRGMVAGTRGLRVGGRSSARIGARLAERLLATQIKEREPGVREITRREDLPLMIRWDFCGHVAERALARDRSGSRR